MPQFEDIPYSMAISRSEDVGDLVVLAMVLLVLGLEVGDALIIPVSEVGIGVEAPSPLGDGVG